MMVASPVWKLMEQRLSDNASEIRAPVPRSTSTSTRKGPTHTMRVFAVVDEAHKLSYEETLTELIREARKYGVGILLASQSVKDFDRVVFDMVGTKISLQLEGEDAKVISENLGLVDKA